MQDTFQEPRAVGAGDSTTGPARIVVALDDAGRWFDAVAGVLGEMPYVLVPVRLGEPFDSVLDAPDVAAVIADASCVSALRAPAGTRRLPLIAVAERYDRREALEAMRSGVADWLSVDQIALLPEVVRREVDRYRDGAPVDRELSRLAAALVANVDHPGRLAEYGREIAGALDATFVLVLVAEPAGELTTAAVCDGAGVSAVQVGSRLRAGELKAITDSTSDAAARAERRFGVPAAWPRHWSVLTVDERVVGMQLISRSGKGFTVRETEAVESLAAVLALAIDRGQAIARLRRADGVKTEFVRSVSHELRTPLNTVIGYADLLADEAFGPLADEQRRILRRVGDRARGLLEVIAATLDLPGIDGGRLSLETRSVSVSDLLRDLEADAREWRVRHDLRYQWDVDAELPAITTDPGKLRVLLKNLIANAVKFTDRGGITVRARARDGGVEFSVEDTGIGIEPEAVHFVFDAFRQANAAATGQYGGVGLGLYIVRRLVGILGGRLRVESEVGVGSKFHIWLPADPA
jgi:signal transduction histidine kinase